MLRGYKASPWGGYDSERHLHVPSSRNFSQVLNYDMPTIIASVMLSLGAIITGIGLLCNPVPWLIGLSVLLFGVALPISVMTGYKGGKLLNKHQYSSWLHVENAYGKMSKANRKRHRKTLTNAFHDENVRSIAERIFDELKLDNDLTALELELSNLLEARKIRRKAIEEVQRYGGTA